jgi:glycosyltransferase involved in cell wall biosynthesis
MACGTVPLTIKHGGALETVGDCGLYVSPKAFIATSMGRFAIPDIEELAEKMVWASQNPEALLRLATKGVEKAKMFNWKNVVEKLDNILRG